MREDYAKLNPPLYILNISQLADFYFARVLLLSICSSSLRCTFALLKRQHYPIVNATKGYFVVLLPPLYYSAVISFSWKSRLPGRYRADLCGDRAELIFHGITHPARGRERERASQRDCRRNLA